MLGADHKGSANRKENAMKQDFAQQPEIKPLVQRHGYGYYFLLTFSTEEHGRMFWQHISSLEGPPAPAVLLWGSWLSVDYGNARRWFAAWLCKGRAESNEISRWEVAARRKDTPSGAGYGSPSSPLGVGMKIERVYETKTVS